MQILSHLSCYKYTCAPLSKLSSCAPWTYAEHLTRVLNVVSNKRWGGKQILLKVFLKKVANHSPTLKSFLSPTWRIKWQLPALKSCPRLLHPQSVTWRKNWLLSPHPTLKACLRPTWRKKWLHPPESRWARPLWWRCSRLSAPPPCSALG